MSCAVAVAVNTAQPRPNPPQNSLGNDPREKAEISTQPLFDACRGTTACFEEFAVGACTI